MAAGSAWPSEAMAALGVLCTLLGAAAGPFAGALSEEFWVSQSPAHLLSDRASYRR